MSADVKPVAAHVSLREESRFNADMCDDREDREREAYYMRVIGACNTIDALQAEIEALRKDAERLEWILPVVSGDDDAATNARTMSLAKQIFVGLAGRVAIDAAMSAQAPATPSLGRAA